MALGIGDEAEVLQSHYPFEKGDRVTVHSERRPGILIVSGFASMSGAPREGWSIPSKFLMHTGHLNESKLEEGPISAFTETRPSHYNQADIECMDALESATSDKQGAEAVCVAMVIKYLWRYRQANGIKDVRKAQQYLNRLINYLETGKHVW